MADGSDTFTTFQLVQGDTSITTTTDSMMIDSIVECFTDFLQHGGYSVNSITDALSNQLDWPTITALQHSVSKAEAEVIRLGKNSKHQRNINDKLVAEINELRKDSYEKLERTDEETVTSPLDHMVHPVPVYPYGCRTTGVNESIPITCERGWQQKDVPGGSTTTVIFGEVDASGEATVTINGPWGGGDQQEYYEEVDRRRNVHLASITTDPDERKKLVAELAEEVMGTDISEWFSK